MIPSKMGQIMFSMLSSGVLAMYIVADLDLILLTVFMICIREVTGSLVTLEYVIVAP